MSTARVSLSTANRDTRSFWCGVLYALLLCLDLGAILVLDSDSEDHSAAQYYEPEIKSSIEFEKDIVKSIPRALQAAHFLHSNQIAKDLFEVEQNPYFIPNKRIFTSVLNHIIKSPWYFEYDSSSSNRLSGWKDSNLIFKSLSLARA